MTKLIIGMGLPGAGKSTILKAFAERYGYDFISVDDIREKNGLIPGQPSTEKEWDEIRALTIEKLNAGKTVIIDGVFLGDIRKKFISFVRENGVQKIQGLLVDTPAEVAWQRNQSREIQTTKETFENRLSHMKNFPPEISDGFDSIISVNENGELIKAQLPKEQTREFNPLKRPSK